MRVKSGDNIILYCDCAMPLGSHIVWRRSCSHEHQPCLFIDTSNMFKMTFPRFSFAFNSSSNYNDLHITNMKADICIKTLTSVSYSQSLTEMERPRLALTTLMCKKTYTYSDFEVLYILLLHQKRIYGEEVEMKVRTGDNITLYCDRSLTLGSFIVWIRNCSHENQPSLIIDFRKMVEEIFQRFSFIHNPYNNSHDLYITNISVSDLGLYYCAELERKVSKDEKGIISQSEVYNYGTRTTRLSLEVTSCSEPSAPPDCLLCWMLLFSVCPACFLLSSICENDDEEVCYASVDVMTRRQKQHREARYVSILSLWTHSDDLVPQQDVEMSYCSIRKGIHGEEVEMKVRPGDNITLYCDRSLTLGSVIVWIRNCSHENQPSLIIDFTKWDLEILKRFSYIHNNYSKSYDLQITNISVSDLGLYYCAELERKVNKDEKGILSSSEVYYYGTRTTRLSLKVYSEQVTSCSEPSAPPDCVLCWTLLFSEEVCYASLDVINKRQKQRKTKRVQSSDFSTYAQVPDHKAKSKKKSLKDTILLFCHKRICGEEVDMKVRPGDNITLYCDRSLTLGFLIVWIRNCSHEDQPSLIIDFTKWDLEILKRFSSIHNSYNNSYDLHITNISVSDLGLYYCAELERKSLIHMCLFYSEPSAPPDCVHCWKLLFSVCPACLLLSSICVFYLCCKKTTDTVTDQKDKAKDKNIAECADEEVCYASLDVITKRQKQRKTKRVQSSDFSTYAQDKIHLFLIGELDPHQHQLFTSLTEMERPRLALTMLMCKKKYTCSVLLFHQKSIYGEEVQMKVRPGDNITLYCDRSLSLGSSTVWIRNCSHENQPSLIIDFRKLKISKIFQHFSFIYNPYSNSHGLHITNISVSDLGLYYCAEEQNMENKKDILSSSKVYYYGKRTTRLSLEMTSCSEPSAHPDCLFCWKLFSVCPVCVLLSSLCLLWLFCRKPTDVITWRQKRHRETQGESSDFTTYAPVRTATE
ncbi:T cell receptor alpha variable 27 [Labeo rohita]|nr:T cell receptor alpha variable 27 [Labeo rohita]